MNEVLHLPLKYIDGKGRERVEFHGLATPTNEIVKAVRAINADTKTKR